MARRLLHDDQWRRVENWLPGKQGDPGRSAADNRLFVEAVLWVARTGAPWRDLPPEFGLWNSVYKRFARWEARGVWHRLFEELAQDAAFEELNLDCTALRAHAGEAAKKAPRNPSGARAAH